MTETASFSVHIIRKSDGRDDSVPFNSREAAEQYADKARTIVNPDHFDVIVKP